MNDPPGLDRIRQLMMAALDEEVSAAEVEELNRALEADAQLKEEWLRLKRAKEVTSMMQVRTPPEEVWGRFWQDVYNRVERGVGWILFSLGLVTLIGYGMWQAVGNLLADTDAPFAIKIAFFAILIGMVILIVSVVREKLFTRRHDAYKEIER